MLYDDIVKLQIPYNYLITALDSFTNVYVWTVVKPYIVHVLANLHNRNNKLSPPVFTHAFIHNQYIGNNHRNSKNGWPVENIFLYGEWIERELISGLKLNPNETNFEGCGINLSFDNSMKKVFHV